MKMLGIWQTIVIVCVLGVSGCSKNPAAPKPVVSPGVVSSEFQYSVGPFDADSGFIVKCLEYADADGVVRKVDYQAPRWEQKVTLKSGDRMYVRAGVGFASVLTGRVQVVGSPGFYASDKAERADGPGTSVLVIDQIVK